MINSAAIYPAYQLAETYANLEFAPVPNLHPLIAASRGIRVQEELANPELHSLSAEAMETDSKAKDLMGVSRHDAANEEIVRLGVIGIQRTFNLARGPVNSLCLEAGEQITKMIEDGVIRDAEIEIVPVFDSKLTKNPTFLDMLSRFGQSITERKVREVELFGGRRWIDLDANERIGFCSVGVASIDECVPEVVGRVSDRGDINPFDVSRWDNVDELAVKYLLLLRANNNIPEGVNMSEVEYRETITNAMVNVGSRFNITMERHYRASRNKQMFIDCDVWSKRTTVFGDVYNAWLKEGGRPEFIMGMMRSGKLELNSKALVEKGDVYLKVLDDYRRKKRAEMMTLMMHLSKTNIAKWFHNYITNEIDQQDQTGARNRLEEFLLKRPRLADEDLLFYLRRLVCDVFFPNTDVLRVLTDIQALQDQSPDMDVRDAAEVALLNWVGDWLTSLFTVTSAK